MGKAKKIKIGVNGLIIGALGAVALLGALLTADLGKPAAAPVDATPSVSEPEPAETPELTAAPEPTAAPGFVETSVTIDGVLIGTLSSREAAEQALDDAEDFFTAHLPVGSSASGGIANDIVLADAPDSTDIMSADALFALLTASDTPLRVEYDVLVSYTTGVDYDTSSRRDSSMLLDTRLYLTRGRKGSVHTVERYRYVNGELTESGVVEQITLIEPIDEVVRVGTLKVKPTAEPRSKEGVEGPDAGELVFAKPIAGTIARYFGGLNGKYHYGIDYKAGRNTPNVTASAAGTVVFARERGGYGLTVEIDHGGGFLTRYAQLESVSVRIGDTVTAGQAIGAVEERGELHFELRVNGVAYNPRFYID